MTSSTIDLYLRSLPYLDGKWLRADLTTTLQSTNDLSILWNNLINDNELVVSNQQGVVNGAGNLSYVGVNGKHYCGVVKLSRCNNSNYCRPNAEHNCIDCQLLDFTDEAGAKKIALSFNIANSFNSSPPLSESMLDSWLWGPIPSKKILMS